MGNKSISFQLFVSQLYSQEGQPSSQTPKKNIRKLRFFLLDRFDLLSKLFQFHPSLQTTRSRLPLLLPPYFISHVSFHLIIHCSQGLQQILSQTIHKTDLHGKVKKVSVLEHTRNRLSQNLNRIFTVYGVWWWLQFGVCLFI